MPGPPGAAVLRAEPSRKHIPAALFREKITELADEYDLMQATLRRLLQQRADGLMGDGPRADAPLPNCEQAADAESTRGFPRADPGALSALSRLPAAPGAGALPTQPSDDEAIDAPPVEEGGPRADPQAGPQEGYSLSSAPVPVENPCGWVTSERNDLTQHSSDAPTSDAPSIAEKTTPRAKTVSWREGFRERPQLDWRTQFFLYLARSTAFERFIGLIIVLNVIFLGVATDVSMSFVIDGSSDALPASLQVTEAGFLGVYVIELTIRLIAFGKHYFSDEHERVWNIFDMVLVVQGLFEQLSWLRTNNPLSGAGNLSFLRGMRLLKTVKMLRVVRLMRSMKELRMIIYAVMGSVKSMMWSLVLLGAVLYMMSLICVQGVVGYLQTMDVDDREGSTYDDILKYWGSVPLGMLTLFMSSTGGVNWDVAFEALSEAGFIFAMAFLAYVSFFMFVIMNAITSLFVEAVMESANNDWLSRVHEQLENKRTHVETLRRLFDEMDESDDGVVSLEEFQRKVQDPKVSAFFASMEIRIQDAVRFFNMLSQDGTVNVDLERFVDFCIRMSGPAQSIDLAEVSITQCILLKDIRDATQMQEAQLAATARMREEVMVHIDHISPRSKGERRLENIL